MTQVQAYGDDGKYNSIKGQLQHFKTLKIVSFQILISNEQAMALFSDASFARKMVKQEQRAGNKNISYVEKAKGVLEIYPGKTKDEITKILIKKLRNAGAKLEK